MRKEEFCFPSRDGKTQIHAARWIPDGEIIGIVQIIHGMSEYVDRYEPFAEFLTGQGFLVTGEDHLGHGKTVTQCGSLQGYFCKQDPATVIVRDVHRLKKMTQEAYPDKPYFVLGHSMGSFMARNYMLRYGKGIQGIIVMGTGDQTPGTLKAAKCISSILRFFQGEKHVSKLMEKMSFGSYLKRIPDAKTPFDWLSVNQDNVKRYMADPMCGFTFTINGYRTVLELLSRLSDKEALKSIPSQLPVLLVSGAEDPVGNYGEAVTALEQALRQSGLKDVTKKLYAGDRHEILNEENHQDVYDDILRWIKGRM